MLKIEEECKLNGWPHPDAWGKPEIDSSYFKWEADNIPSSAALTRPDGTLPSQQASPLINDLKTAAPLTNPDGTLFKMKLEDPTN